VVQAAVRLVDLLRHFKEKEFKMTDYLGELGDIEATSLLTLHCHALESQSKNPILDDPTAVEIVGKLAPTLSKSKNTLYKKMAKGKIDKNLIVHVALRAKKYDEYIRSFLSGAPDGVVVNIGCGFDTRFQRIDNGKVTFYDLDLPEVIHVKKNLLEENERYHFIDSSVLEHAWMAPLLKYKECSFLFMAEGVFMYLDRESVKSLVLKLQSQFPGCELVCEVFNSLWLSKPLKGMVNFKMQQELHLGKDVTYDFGMRNSREMETWDPGIELLDDWSYFDEPEPKIGMIRLFRYVEFLRKTQWTVHYRLN
jgi:methyltransferase (TIGR00027 family)